MPIEHIHHHYHHKSRNNSAITEKDVEQSRRNRIKTKKLSPKEYAEFAEKRKRKTTETEEQE